jgi:hypothetical protein
MAGIARPQSWVRSDQGWWHRRSCTRICAFAAHHPVGKSRPDIEIVFFEMDQRYGDRWQRLRLAGRGTRPSA